MAESEKESNDVSIATSYLAEEAVREATLGVHSDKVVKDSVVKTAGDEDRDPEVSKLECEELENLTRREALTARGLTPSAASLGITDIVQECMKENSEAGTSIRLQIFKL